MSQGLYLLSWQRRHTINICTATRKQWAVLFPSNSKLSNFKSSYTGSFHIFGYNELQQEWKQMQKNVGTITAHFKLYFDADSLLTEAGLHKMRIYLGFCPLQNIHRVPSSRRTTELLPLPHSQLILTLPQPRSPTNRASLCLSTTPQPKIIPLIHTFNIRKDQHCHTAWNPTKHGLSKPPAVKGMILPRYINSTLPRATSPGWNAEQLKTDTQSQFAHSMWWSNNHIRWQFLPTVAHPVT